jgi:SAM-dependent methyltransferase
MATMPERTAFLAGWAFGHSVLLVVSSAIALILNEPVIVGAAAASSFGAFFALGFRESGTRRIVHPANVLTALRLAAVIGLSIRGSRAGGLWIVGAGLGFVAVDALDGWIALKTGKTSAFGEFFDKETDAFFVLSLCLLSIRKGLFPPWIVSLGLLRYLFVIAAFLFASKTAQETRSGRGRTIHTTVVLVLLAAFVPLPFPRLPLALLACFLLGASFGLDGMRTFGARSRARNTVGARPVRDQADVAAFFDELAADYRERHGRPDRLLRTRLRLIRDLARIGPDAVILEIGCGTAVHLLRLVGGTRRGLGIDLSPAMIAAAERSAADASDQTGRVALRTDDAESLATVADESVDVAFCVGSIEHFLDRRQAVRSAFRVLKKGGRFVCLTPNGSWIYYRRLAPLLGRETRHLATDAFLTKPAAESLLGEAGFSRGPIGYWSFIPRGDMTPLMGRLFTLLDAIGRAAGVPALRGGLYFVGRKQRSDESGG